MVEQPLPSIRSSGNTASWKDACAKVPFCLGTDCKSLYDTCIKPASSTKDKRVALDLLDVREGIEYFNDTVRWVPTDHMLVDCLTKAMHPSLLNKYTQDYKYSFKYDELLHATKRAAAKERKQEREAKLKQGGNKQKGGKTTETQQEQVHAVFFCSCRSPSSAQSSPGSEYRSLSEMPTPSQVPPWRQQGDRTQGNSSSVAG